MLKFNKIAALDNQIAELTDRANDCWFSEQPEAALVVESQLEKLRRQRAYLLSRPCQHEHELVYSC